MPKIRRRSSNRRRKAYLRYKLSLQECQRRAIICNNKGVDMMKAKNYCKALGFLYQALKWARNLQFISGKDIDSPPLVLNLDIFLKRSKPEPSHETSLMKKKAGQLYFCGHPVHISDSFYIESSYGRHESCSIMKTLVTFNLGLTFQLFADVSRKYNPLDLLGRALDWYNISALQLMEGNQAGHLLGPYTLLSMVTLNNFAVCQARLSGASSASRWFDALLLMLRVVVVDYCAGGRGNHAAAFCGSTEFYGFLRNINFFLPHKELRSAPAA